VYIARAICRLVESSGIYEFRLGPRSPRTGFELEAQ